MNNEALATTKNGNNSAATLLKDKPRYTKEENQLLFESWWNPQKRRKLADQLGRKMSALRSQFCRLLKEAGISNQEYYNMMQAKYTDQNGLAPRKRSREIKNVDRIILEVFAKHQALGNSRTMACQELQETLGDTFTTAALKLRFYRLLKRLAYQDEDLLRIGKQALGETMVKPSKPEIVIAESVEAPKVSEAKLHSMPIPENQIKEDKGFFYQLSSLPETIEGLEERVNLIEAQQRHQLDLRGFIEHLLAVERDLKREDRLMEEIQKLIAENDGLQKSIKANQEKLHKREAELAGVYKMLDTMLADFMRLESVSKLASLGDFMHRLEITVDQFGNVLKSRRVDPV